MAPQGPRTERPSETDEKTRRGLFREAAKRPRDVRGASPVWAVRSGGKIQPLLIKKTIVGQLQTLGLFVFR